MAETNHNSTGGSAKKFEEALQLLNEAAREKKDEIQHLLSGKYSDIQNLIKTTAQAKAAELGHYRELAEEAIGEGTERVKAAAGDVDRKVRENPWPYVGGAALAALLLGFIMGNSKDK